MTAALFARPACSLAKESDFQAAVVGLARTCGFRVAHFRAGMDRRGRWLTAVAADGVGFPDLVLCRDRVLFRELKVGRNKLTSEQEAWRDALLAAGCDWALWTPSDWDEIQQVLEVRAA